MKLIELSGKKGKGVFVKVDDEDYEMLIKLKWNIGKAVNTNYARSVIKNELGKYVHVFMHRYIMGINDSNIFCDHKDHDGLNNQKDNLRACTRSQNGMNGTAKNGSTSKYLGVGSYTRKLKYGGHVKCWTARIKINGSSHNIGTFPFTIEGEIIAAKKYDEWAKKQYKEFANLNFK